MGHYTRNKFHVSKSYLHCVRKQRHCNIINYFGYYYSNSFVKPKFFSLTCCITSLLVRNQSKNLRDLFPPSVSLTTNFSGFDLHSSSLRLVFLLSLILGVLSFLAVGSFVLKRIRTEIFDKKIILVCAH